MTFGLEDDPIGALERMAGFVEGTGRSHGIAEPLQMTIAATDGEGIYAARYASGPVVNSLFVSEDTRSVRALYPDDERFSIFSDESRVIVSEPLSDMPGIWRRFRPVPHSSSSPATTSSCPSRPWYLPDGHRGQRRELWSGVRDRPDGGPNVAGD